MNSFDHTSGSFFTHDGARLYYEQHGPGSAPWLVLLHGGMGSIEGFNHILPALAGHFRVLGIDSRGHGRSTLGDGRLTYQRLEADVAALLDHLQTGPVRIIGFSDGGTLGYRLALRRNVVERLVAIGGSWDWKNHAEDQALFRGLTGAGWRQKFPDSHATYQQINPEPDFDRLLEATVRMWTDASETGYPGDAVARIQCPVLVMRGDEDPLFRREAAFTLATRLPQARLFNLPFAGHEAHEDQPDLCLPVILRFLDDGKGHGAPV